MGAVNICRHVAIANVSLRHGSDFYCVSVQRSLCNVWDSNQASTLTLQWLLITLLAGMSQ